MFSALYIKESNQSVVLLLIVDGYIWNKKQYIVKHTWPIKTGVKIMGHEIYHYCYPREGRCVGSKANKRDVTNNFKESFCGRQNDTVWFFLPST